MANDIPTSAQAQTIKKLQRKLKSGVTKMEDYKKQVESEKKAMQQAFELELFKSKEETEQIRHENEVLKKKIAQVQRLFNSNVQVQDDNQQENTPKNAQKLKRIRQPRVTVTTQRKSPSREKILTKKSSARVMVKSSQLF